MKQTHHGYSKDKSEDSDNETVKKRTLPKNKHFGSKNNLDKPD